jgi:hypothetical protein
MDDDSDENNKKYESEESLESKKYRLDKEFKKYIVKK